jgi:polar amino acid transport system substrate-binding protein
MQTLTVIVVTFITTLSLLKTERVYAGNDQINPFSERVIDAVTLDYPPYEYLDNGQPAGLAVEIIQEAIKRTGASGVNFSFLPWKRAVKFTQLGRSDLLFNAGKNEERQQWGLYVDSTLINQTYVLFKRKDSNISVNPNFDNVKDHSIAIRAGYLYGSGAFRTAIDNDRFDYVMQSDSTDQSVRQLLEERVDLFVGDYLPVMHYIKENMLTDRIDIVHEPGSDKHMVVLEWPTYLLFSKKRVTEQYVQQVNDAMKEMKADGSYSKIYDKYTAQLSR